MILGIDSSAVTAGCALYDKGKVIAEEFLNAGQTHSQTLMPMIKSMLKTAGFVLDNVKKIAVTAGPGSFTGLRIGISLVKGIALGADKPCVPVSTLEAIACNFSGFEDITVCACMDARRQQLYNAVFKAENGGIRRLCEDRAISAEDLSRELENLSGNIVLAGDGAELMHKFTEHKYSLAPYALRFQRGSGVCIAALDKEEVSAAAVMPVYLRLPQAERERLEKISGGEK